MKDLPPGIRKGGRSDAQKLQILRPLLKLSMKFAYDIAWLIAVSVDLCVIVAFLKAIALKWLDISLQNILEEKKARIQEREIGVSEAIILQREARRVEE